MNSNPMWYALHEPWEEVMPEVLRQHACLLVGAEEEQKWLEWVRPWIEKAPIPVRTVYDFVWWVSTSLKWQYDCMRLFLNRCDTPQDLQRMWRNVVHFYATDEWEQWGFHNHARKIKDLAEWA